MSCAGCLSDDDGQSSVRSGQGTNRPGRVRVAGALSGEAALAAHAALRPPSSFAGMVKCRGVAACVLVFLLGLRAPGWAGNKNADPPTTADRIVIVKSARTLTLMRDGRVLKTYSVALGADPVGPKVKEGDNKTPEGEYVIDSKNAHSRFHLALHISYPNAADRARAHRLGVKPGGEVMIHGLEAQYAWLGSRHRLTDWTAGCIAVTNPEIEEIWRLVPNGTPVDIQP